MIGFFIVVALALAALAASVWWLLHLQRRYGFAELPPEIDALDEELKSGTSRFSLGGFTPDRDKGGRVTWRRVYESKDGTWDVVVECEADAVIAYQARFRHDRSRWMNATRERWYKQPKIIVIEGCA